MTPCGWGYALERKRGSEPEVTRSYKKLQVLPTRILVTYLHDRRVEGGGVEQTTDPGAHRGLHRGRPIRQLLVPGGDGGRVGGGKSRGWEKWVRKSG